jgi:hypothetical protein
MRWTRCLAKPQPVRFQLGGQFLNVILHAFVDGCF